MTMEMEDLQNKMRDIQNMKVTREIQRVSVLWLQEANQEIFELGLLINKELEGRGVGRCATLVLI